MHFGVFGAGSIGCYVGGMLVAGGEKVTLVGRAAMAVRLCAGIDLTGHDRSRRDVSPEALDFGTDPAALRACDTVFVCVKSGDTARAGAILQDAAKRNAVIVSLQNGISNATELHRLLPGRTVLAAMVPFNVARIGESRFHRGTEGSVLIEAGEKAEEIARRLSYAGVPARTSTDIQAVLWGKLVMNLNNAVNVLSGLPLKVQLSQRDHRRVLALSVEEALKAMKAAGIRPARIGRVRPRIVPKVLRLPDWLFGIVAAGMLKIDDEARSSMAEDLEARRKPEIDYLNGEIVRLGEKAGVATPVNRKLTELVKQAFAARKSPKLSGGQLLELVAVGESSGLS